MGFDRQKAFEVSNDGVLLENGTHLSSGSFLPTAITHPNAITGDRFFQNDGTAFKFNGTIWVKIIESDADSNGASPGFIFGDPGNSTKGTYLSNEGVPSNIVGIPIDISLPRLKKIGIANQNSSLWSVTIVEHNGVVFTDLITVSVNPISRRQSFIVDVALTQGLELAARIDDASISSAKNAKVVCSLKGTLI